MAGSSRSLFSPRSFGQPLIFTIVLALVAIIGVPAITLVDSVNHVPASAGATARTSDSAGQPIAFGAAHTFAVRRPRLRATEFVGMAATPNGTGYWLAAADGQVFAFGAARLHSSRTNATRRSPIVAIVATPDGGGYWLATRVGSVVAFGDARHYRSRTGGPFASPIVAMAATADGHGYWLASADGKVAAYGDALRFRSTSAQHLGNSVVAMAATSRGQGYWLVTASGGVFAFGDARSFGSLPTSDYTAPIVGITSTTHSRGYLLASSNGGVFTFGHARFHGSAGASALPNPIVAIAGLPNGTGYWLLPTMPARLAVPTPGFIAGRVTAIGDSVMLDAAPDLEADIPGIVVDASVGRPWDSGVAVVQQLRAEHQLGAVVVIDLGTNGPVSAAQFRSMMAALAGAALVVFVTVHLPPSYSWSRSVNATLEQGVPNYPNARLVNFNALADANPQWFGPDGVHMAIGGPGAQAMARLIASAVRG